MGAGISQRRPFFLMIAYQMRLYCRLEFMPQSLLMAKIDLLSRSGLK